MARNSTIKQDLARFREKSGWSINKISDKTGVPLRTIESWLAGDRTPPDYVTNLVLRKAYYELDLEANRKEESEKTLYVLYTARIRFDARRHTSIEEAVKAEDELGDEAIIGRFETLDGAIEELEKISLVYRIEEKYFANANVAWVNKEVYALDEDGNLDYSDVQYEDVQMQMRFPKQENSTRTYDYERLAFACKNYTVSGMIARYDGELYFVEIREPLSLYDSYNLDGWWSSIEKNFVFDEITSDCDDTFKLAGDKHRYTGADITNMFNQ